MKRNVGYERTMLACYVGYITQAIVNNFAPLLFLTFQRQYGIPLSQIAMIASINFGIQLAVDLIAAKFVDRIGYRPCMIAAHIFAAVGLIGLSFFPEWLPNPFAGVLLAVFFYAIGGGLCEVLVSPIAEACPTEKKDAQMSLLHSFYCWGVVAVIGLSTLFFVVFGIEHWKILACCWAIVPLCNIFNFAVVPISQVVEEGEGMSILQLLKSRLFWLLALLMVCSGASELAMGQWASAFTESALKVSKTVGDVAGPCLFALLQGCARAYYGTHSEKIELSRFMLGSAALCVVCYLLAALSGVPALGLRFVRTFGGHHVAGNVQHRLEELSAGRNGDVRAAGAGGRRGRIDWPGGDRRGFTGGERQPANGHSGGGCVPDRADCGTAGAAEAILETRFGD